MSEPFLCSVCKTAVAAFDDDGFILFVVFVFVFVLMMIVFLEKKDDVPFFNTALDADDIICCCSLVYVVVDSNFARVRRVCVCILTECFVLPIRRENARVMI